MKKNSANDTPRERRYETRTVLDQYYSVEFRLKDIASTYQFKLRDISSNGMGILVHKGSEVLRYLKVGDTLVFDPFLNPEKSTMAMCPEALLPILVRICGVWEMMAEWAESGEEELPQITFSRIRCLDPGLEDGGVGGVIFELRGEKITPINGKG